MSYKLTVKITGDDRTGDTLDLLTEVISRLAERHHGISWRPMTHGVRVDIDPAVDELVKATIASAVCDAREIDAGMLTGRACQGRIGHRGRHLFRTPVEVEVESLERERRFQEEATVES